MGRERYRARRGVVVIVLVGIAVAVALQSLLHLELSLRSHRIDTVFDLDRSNGVPDILSTLALAACVVFAGALSGRAHGFLSATARLLAVVLAALTLADLLHDGAHPGGPRGVAVIWLAAVAVALLLVVAVNGSRGTRAILALGLVSLLGAFVVPGLDRYDRWFERERGDPVREYQIVAKEDLELIGWSLVALALWWEASSRRRAAEESSATTTASRAPAAPKRRAA